MTEKDLRFISSTSGLWCVKELSNPKIGYKTIRKFVRINVYKDDANDCYILKVISANNSATITSFGITKMSVKDYEILTDGYNQYDKLRTYDIPLMRAARLYVCGTDDMELLQY